MHVVSFNTAHPPTLRQDLIYERLLWPFLVPAKPRLRFVIHIVLSSLIRDSKR